MRVCVCKDTCMLQLGYEGYWTALGQSFPSCLKLCVFCHLPMHYALQVNWSTDFWVILLSLLLSHPSIVELTNVTALLTSTWLLRLWPQVIRFTWASKLVYFVFGHRSISLHVSNTCEFHLIVFLPTLPLLLVFFLFLNRKFSLLES